MAKFIIEVSDEYIREHADSEKMAAKVAAMDGHDALSGLFDIIAFNNIKKQIDEGKTEFAFTVDDMGDDKDRQIFDMAVSRVVMLDVIKKAKMKKEEQD